MSHDHYLKLFQNSPELPLAKNMNLNNLFSFFILSVCGWSLNNQFKKVTNRRHILEGEELHEGSFNVINLNSRSVTWISYALHLRQKAYSPHF